MEMCWHSEPSQRPTAHRVLSGIQETITANSKSKKLKACSRSAMEEEGPWDVSFLWDIRAQLEWAPFSMPSQLTQNVLAQLSKEFQVSFVFFQPFFF